MKLQALEIEVIYALMVVGAICAAFGLYLMLRRTDNEGAARIELFGLKFQASSTGTLVFLVGAALLLLPLFVPRAVDPEGDVISGTAPQIVDPARQVEVSGGLAVPVGADAIEIEPNNVVSEPNQFQLGFGVKGSINRDRDDYFDWYVVDVSQSGQTDYSLKVRSPNGACRVVAYDEQEEEIDDVYCSGNGGARTIDLFAPDSKVLLIRVSFNGGSGSRQGSYELFLE